MEHEKQARRLESEIDSLERESDRVGEHIENVRSDWEAKERDASVPGAQPDPGEGEEAIAGAETDPSTVSDQGGP